MSITGSTINEDQTKAIRAAIGAFKGIVYLLGYEVGHMEECLYPGKPDQININIYRKDWKNKQQGRRYVGQDPKEHDYV